MKVKREQWETNFSEWFRNVISRSEYYDYRYPVKGTGVWRPLGMRLRRNILNIMRRLLEDTGHDEVLFPTLIPETLIRKESEHIKKFEEEIFWVTRGGKESLTSRLALRPTSETAIMEMFRLWIHAHTDLPVKIYQVVSVFRCETKATAPLIRVREISTFKEAHTAHKTREEAEQQVKDAIKIYKKFFDDLCIPYLISLRPEWDKFAGAVYTIAFDTILPDGKTLQIGTVHYLGTNFSQEFEVTYLTPEGKHEYVHTTSYGISERVVAAIISVHGDDHGIVLPPNVAPIQVVIIPIIYGDGEEILKACRDIYEKMKKKGYSVVLDDRSDITPGEKYYYWELRGVPLRIEVGPRDLKEDTVTIVKRDTLERTTIPKNEITVFIETEFENIKRRLKERAWKWFNSRVTRSRNISDATRLLDEKKGIVEVPWCGGKKCGLQIEERTNSNILGYDIDPNLSDATGEKCVNCGGEAKYWTRVSKRY